MNPNGASHPSATAETKQGEEWPGDGREPCGCNGTPHFLTPACPLPPPRYYPEPDGLYDY